MGADGCGNDFGLLIRPLRDLAVFVDLVDGFRSVSSPFRDALAESLCERSCSM